jgi:hypothetical protein
MVKEILKKNPSRLLAMRIRERLRKAIKGKRKSGSAIGDLGMSVEMFKGYIAQFFAEGMSWDNYGKWHLDHIRPISSFNLEIREEFLQAVHYSNMQPLWAADNDAKGARFSPLG